MHTEAAHRSADLVLPHLRPRRTAAGSAVPAGFPSGRQPGAHRLATAAGWSSPPGSTWPTPTSQSSSPTPWPRWSAAAARPCSRPSTTTPRAPVAGERGRSLRRGGCRRLRTCSRSCWSPRGRWWSLLCDEPGCCPARRASAAVGAVSVRRGRDLPRDGRPAGPRSPRGRARPVARRRPGDAAAAAFDRRGRGRADRAGRPRASSGRSSGRCSPPLARRPHAGWHGPRRRDGRTLWRRPARDLGAGRRLDGGRRRPAGRPSRFGAILPGACRRPTTRRPCSCSGGRRGVRVTGRWPGSPPSAPLPVTRTTRPRTCCWPRCRTGSTRAGCRACGCRGRHELPRACGGAAGGPDGCRLRGLGQEAAAATAPGRRRGRRRPCRTRSARPRRPRPRSRALPPARRIR